MPFPPDEFEDRDAQHLSRLPPLTKAPVFVMGLHRSGTTWLFDLLAELLGFRPLTAYDLLYYKRLLDSHLKGTADRERAELEAHFRSLGLVDRQIDRVALNAETVEEYAFLLGKHHKWLWVTDKSAPFVRELCQKLLFTRPSEAGVLLKNPNDVGRADVLLREFPDARFVCIRRDPLRILNSQMRSGLILGGQHTPYLDMLLQGIPPAQWFMRGEKAYYRLFGEPWFLTTFLRILKLDIRRALGDYRRMVETLPPDRWVEVSYEHLVAAPASALAPVVDFLGLEPRRPLHTVKPRPRQSRLHPAVEAYGPTFRRALRERGLP